MTTFKRRVISGIITALVAFSLSAMGQSAPQEQSQPQSQSQNDEQNGQRKGQMARQHPGLFMLARKLDLTDDQKQQFQQIHQKIMDQTKTIRSDSSLSDDDKKQKLEELHKQARAQMMAVLTPQQKEKLKQLREQQKKDQDDKTQKKDDDDLFSGMTKDDPGL